MTMSVAFDQRSKGERLALIAAVVEEQMRCAEAVVKMRNQRGAYRTIIRNSKAELPKYGHWADPFCEEKAAMLRDECGDESR